MGGERVAVGLLDRSEVLTDDDRRRPVTLEGDNGEQVVSRVVDVGAVGRATWSRRIPPPGAMLARIVSMNGW